MEKITQSNFKKEIDGLPEKLTLVTFEQNIEECNPSKILNTIECSFDENNKRETNNEKLEDILDYDEIVENDEQLIKKLNYYPKINKQFEIELTSFWYDDDFGSMVKNIFNLIKSENNSIYKSVTIYTKFDSIGDFGLIIKSDNYNLIYVGRFHKIRIKNFENEEEATVTFKKLDENTDEKIKLKISNNMKKYVAYIETNTTYIVNGETYEISEPINIIDFDDDNNIMINNMKLEFIDSIKKL